jgi:hypothetical protein
LEVDFPGRSCRSQDAGVVDQQFDRAELSLDTPDDLRCPRLVGDVCREAQGAAA